jgi:hypothetical protein
MWDASGCKANFPESLALQKESARSFEGRFSVQPVGAK